MAEGRKAGSRERPTANVVFSHQPATSIGLTTSPFQIPSLCLSMFLIHELGAMLIFCVSIISSLTLGRAIKNEYLALGTIFGTVGLSMLAMGGGKKEAAKPTMNSASLTLVL